MAQHIVSLIANAGIFQGLAKQNMLFHQCISELVDNSIAAKDKNRKFKIQIIFENINNDFSYVYIVDDCAGMTLNVFEKALQLGESATTDCRLNEHGFGLKNSLATLSSSNGDWKIWTRDKNLNKVLSVTGPFNSQMFIEDNDQFPNSDILPTPDDISTLIKVKVKKSFIQTLQGRGAPTTDLERLREWLIEHLGVMYRGYLEQDDESYDNEGVIIVSIGNDTLQVPPIQVPFGNKNVEYMDIEIGGETYNLKYYHGTLDEVRRNSLVRGQPTKYYYQGNIPTQGIDIRLGKRVIAVKQLETIWKTDDNNRISQLSRHNDFNDFVGELVIPNLPRGILTTVNNKTDFNLDDMEWQKIFNRLNDFRPKRNIRTKTEAVLKNKWMGMLKATNPEEQISDEISVWPTGVRIDVYRKTLNNDIIIYELKVGTASPIHIYQLKMYWDGLVLNGEQPREAILLVEDFHTNIEEMINKMNTITPPNKSKPYNFKIEKQKNKGL